MITIASSKNISEPTLIGLEASLTTPNGVYEFSSEEALSFPDSNLFGAISWPRSRFRLGSDLIIEQQMFVPHDGGDFAISWELSGKLIPARLVVRPHFGGCNPRSYRDVGFRYDAQEKGGRLFWLPSVLGPRIIADTNGRYNDEPVRSANIGDTSIVVPGTFEFDLSSHPSILIFSNDSCTRADGCQQVGMFLAGLLADTSRRSVTAPLNQAGISNRELIAA